MTARRPKPKDDARAGLRWIWSEELQKYIEVCEFCGGNCGQCAITARVGHCIPPSMSLMVNNLLSVEDEGYMPQEKLRGLHWGVWGIAYVGLAILFGVAVAFLAVATVLKATFP